MNTEDVISVKKLLQGGLKTPEISTCASGWSQQGVPVPHCSSAGHMVHYLELISAPALRRILMIFT